MAVKEVEVIESLMKKLDKKFPNLIAQSREEFLEFFGKDLPKDSHTSQYFYSWFFSDLILKDGKNIICLCLEVLDLNEKETLMLKNIQKGVNGFFKIWMMKNKNVELIDLLTKKEYSIKVIDFDKGLSEGRIIEATLVKNFNEDYFFFGGAKLNENTRGYELNLLEYSRDLTTGELVEQEMLIIKRLSKPKDKLSLTNYLEEVLELDEKQIENFLQISKDEQKKIIEEQIIEFLRGEQEERNDLWEDKTKINGVWVKDDFSNEEKY